MNMFKIPESIYFGENAMEALKTLQGKKAVIVTGGSSMKKFGFIAQTQQLLGEAGIDSLVFDGVEPNPSVQTVVKGAQAMRDFEPDWIIAIGGGSALDAAKIMWCFYEHPQLDFADIIPVGSMPALRTKAKFVAIPSTSGTASEITAFSVITDLENHIKYPIVSAHIVPDVAIIDPALPAKMPPHITANTGMDVMAHALEAFASIAANDYSDPLAMRAVKLVFENIEAAYKHGDDMAARDNMHNASTLAGMAFSNVSLGLVHSLAHKIGGEFGVTHGLANAILMPYIIEYNKQSTDKYAEIEHYLGLESIENELRALNAKLDIPLTFKEITEVEISEEAFLAVLDRMSQNAFDDPCTLTNPGTPTAADVKEIYRRAYFG
ncbi:iron-containing alcohol dehydrogenase [Vibrio scophthalmi]|uniref:iron-containing alcohol dehydrogenase n=1 Tax=Vibrio TaxID=662 RepID=UPI00021BECAB|nr:MULTISPECIES: iron-containing alcohol dehydrogenase [Vibrio]EGU35302.1 iron-containing alcohol dehydrogenase [Vibrio sp. N418]MCY9802535.1 iron-containing alcohol dehydrogenase [Vibrio scophthalmi]